MPTDGTSAAISKRRLRYAAVFGRAQTSNPLDRSKERYAVSGHRLMNYARCVARISRAGRMFGIAIRLRNIMAAGPKPKLLSHVNEACTAIFAIEKVEYSGHMLLTDHRCKLSKIPRRLVCKSELDHI